jgi:hypothetical protein
MLTSVSPRHELRNFPAAPANLRATHANTTTTTILITIITMATVIVWR